MNQYEQNKHNLEDLASSICNDDNQIRGQETEEFNPNAMGSYKPQEIIQL